ncbi:MAG: DUF3152 domain-containing protein, partial [Pseudonocardia sediminis]
MQVTRSAVLVATAAVIVSTLAACGSDPEPTAPAGAPAPAAQPTRTPTPAVPASVSADRLAGLRDRVVPPTGTGRLVVAPGSTPAPRRARTVPVRVEVEQGVHVDPAVFATFVTTTLNDPRSWGHDGSVGFARTAGDAPLQVVLASPATTDRFCAPLDTNAALSCRSGNRAVINAARWANGTPEYASDLTAYRRYVVNHEVGHWLGHDHVPCPGRGRPAPVMQQ